MPAAEASSVVVVSYRPGNWLRPCLESVVDQAAEVIVVDNGSPAAEASSIARGCGARPVRLDRNTGFAGGARAGLVAARGEVVGVLNDDAVAGPGWIAASARVLEDPAIAAVTPKVVLSGYYLEVAGSGDAWFAPGDHRPLGQRITSITVDGAEVLEKAVGGGLHEVERGAAGERWRWTSGPKPFYVPADRPEAEVSVGGERVATGPPLRVLNHAGSFLLGHGVAGEYGFGAPDDGRFDEPAERFGFSATAPVFRAETLERIGGFAPAFFAYNEDTDWCLRARLAGLRIVYEPSATVTHRLSATSGGAAEDRVRHLAQRNALLCLVRNAPLGLARKEVAARLRMPRGGAVRRDLLRRLPWAVATRVSMSRKWSLEPEEVWERWAGRDAEWDDSPAAKP